MGAIIGKGVGDAMQKNRDQMAEMQRNQVERQLEMQNIMRERMMAMQIARARELLKYWVGPFYVLATLACVGAARRNKSPRYLSPIIPLSFIVGYQADLAYGSKIKRIRSMSEDILVQEMGLLELPGGPVTINSVDERRSRTATPKSK